MPLFYCFKIDCCKSSVFFQIEERNYEKANYFKLIFAKSFELETTGAPRKW